METIAASQVSAEIMGTNITMQTPMNIKIGKNKIKITIML